MASISVFAWSAVFIGFFLSILLGKATDGRPGVGGVIGLAIAGVLLGPALSFATGVAHMLCQGAKLCAPTTDTTVWDVAYPIILIPGYWIAMGIGAAIASNAAGAAPTPAPPADAEAIASALAQFRSGAAITEVCPSCHSTLVVRPAKPKPGRDPDALRLTCECGASNGVYAAD